MCSQEVITERFSNRISILLSALTFMISLTANGQISVLHKEVNKGFEISVASSSYRLMSNSHHLNNLPVVSTGFNVGAMWSNQITKARVYSGLYYTNTGVPRDIDLLNFGVASNVYGLQLFNKRVRFVEPYLSTGFELGVSSFFGNYMSSDKVINYSITKEPLIGKTYSTKINLGAGVELHYENDQRQFLHFFAELRYGIPISTAANVVDLSGTVSKNLMGVLLGIQFGIIKQKDY